ncbi:MAG: NAD-dependent epimerase/dehydratase family protein [Gammaproteobacteria bacterium]
MAIYGEGQFDTCVVTGGSGAIGARLTQRLLDAGAKTVHVVDDLSSGYEWLLPDDPRIKLTHRDIVDVFNGSFDVPNAHVFHLAAFFANQNSVERPLDDLHTNGAGTLTVLKWAAENNAKRVVYASAGCSIAGHGIDAPIAENMPVSLDLDTPYQITKALGEFYCNYYLSNVSNVRCRFFNSYGPGEVPGVYRNVIPNFIWLAMHDKPLTITGTGEETRDFIYVDDLIEGLMRCALKDEAHGEAINLGTGRQTRIDELAKTIIELTDSKSEIIFAPRRSWDNSKTRQANIDKARKILELDPDTRIGEGLKATVQWFRDHAEQVARSSDF